MKALFLNGSARGDKGVTARLINSLSGGMIDAGIETSVFNISSMKISPCKACLYCMHVNPGVCRQNDDMNIIYAHLKQSDVLIFGSPVYLDGITAQLKSVIDRMVCCMEPFLVTDSKGLTRHSFSWRLPENFIFISTSGFPEPETFRPLKDYFKALAANAGSELIAEFCIPGSIAIQMKPELLEKKLVLLSQAGREFGSSRAFDSEIIEKINTPLFSKEEYFKISEAYENWCRKKLSSKSE